jgi:uncharacterized protein (TIGR00251 family)
VLSLSLHPCLEERKDSIFISLNIHPNSSKNRISLTDYSIEIYIKEPPSKGKANQGLIKYLSKILEISSSSIILIYGEKSRKKIVSVAGLTQQQVIDRMNESSG